MSLVHVPTRRDAVPHHYNTVSIKHMSHGSCENPKRCELAEEDEAEEEPPQAAAAAADAAAAPSVPDAAAAAALAAAHPASSDDFGVEGVYLMILPGSANLHTPMLLGNMGWRHLMVPDIIGSGT